MSVEITKIKLQLAGQEIEITAEEAKQLRDELNKLLEEPKADLAKLQDYFDKWQEKQPKKEYVPLPYPVPYYLPQPIYIEPYSPWPPYTVWGSVGSLGHTNI